MYYVKEIALKLTDVTNTGTYNRHRQVETGSRVHHDLSVSIQTSFLA